MAIRIVRLGSKRVDGEGVRIGTVRRPPRGVARALFALHDWYDVWYPVLAPSPELVGFALEANEPKAWATFTKRYRAEMRQTDAAHSLELLAALSHTVNFSVGCYCESEARCHRSVLRDLLKERGAEVVA